MKKNWAHSQSPGDSWRHSRMRDALMPHISKCQHTHAEGDEQIPASLSPSQGVGSQLAQLIWSGHNEVTAKDGLAQHR